MNPKIYVRILTLACLFYMWVAVWSAFNTIGQAAIAAGQTVATSLSVNDSHGDKRLTYFDWICNALFWMLLAHTLLLYFKRLSRLDRYSFMFIVLFVVAAVLDAVDFFYSLVLWPGAHIPSAFSLVLFVFAAVSFLISILKSKSIEIMYGDLPFKN